VESASKEPSLLHQVHWVVVLRVVGIVTTFVGNILAARLLGPAQFGLYLFISSIAAFGGLIGSAGLSDAVLRFASESLALGRHSMAVAYVLRIAKLCVGTTLLAVGIISAILLAVQWTTGQFDELTLLVALTVLTLVALSWQQLAGETLRSWNELKLASMFSGGVGGGPISNLLFVAGIALFMSAGIQLTSIGALGLLAASVCITVPFALWCVWSLIRADVFHSREVAVSLSKVDDRQLIGMASSVFAIQLLAFVGQQLDIWIGQAVLPPEDLGEYGVAKRCMLLTAMPVQMAMLSVAAAIPRLHAQGRRTALQNLLRGSAGLAALPSLAAMVLLVVFPGFVLSKLFGDSYGGAVLPMRILAVGNLVLILTGNPINPLTLTGYHRLVLPVNLLSAVFIAIAGPLAGMKFGVAGLSWVSTGALTLQNGLLWWLAWRKVGIWTHVGLPSLLSAGDETAGRRVSTWTFQKTTVHAELENAVAPQFAVPSLTGPVEEL
jgi:O-antigen/teichoic acid export membrane protein